MSATKRKQKLLPVFEIYKTGDGIDSRTFMKILKDADLLDSSLQTHDVDLIFTKAKPKTSRKLDLASFQEAVVLVAAKKNANPADIEDYIVVVAGEGKRFEGVTVPEDARFYDDKSTYTGVHKVGGPTIIDREKLGLENLLDRTPADVRGLKHNMKQADVRTPPPTAQKSSVLSPEDSSLMLQRLENRLKNTSFGGDMSANTPPPQVPPAVHSPYVPPTPPTHSGAGHHDERAHSSTIPLPPSESNHYQSHANKTSRPHQQSAPHTTTTTSAVEPEQHLFDVYCTFCTNSESMEMDSARFVKICRDAKILVDNNVTARSATPMLTVTDADLIFQKSKKSGNYGKKISYEDFRTVAIPAISARLGLSIEDVIHNFNTIRGPSLNKVTVAGEVRFHDDISTYTGVHTGGAVPEFSANQNAVTMENLLDRSPADVRGVKVAGGGAAAPRSSAPYKPTYAGEANKGGGIYDRLSNQSSYTGVYARNAEAGVQGGAIGQHAAFKGNTNTGTDTPVHDISQILSRR